MARCNASPVVDRSLASTSGGVDGDDHKTAERHQKEGDPTPQDPGKGEQTDDKANDVEREESDGHVRRLRKCISDAITVWLVTDTRVRSAWRLLLISSGMDGDRGGSRYSVPPWSRSSCVRAYR